MGKQRHTFETVAALALICIFTVFALLLVMMGSQIYQKTASAMQDSGQVRTGLAYVGNKVRYGGTDRVSVVEKDGVSALAIDEAWEEVTYQTLIYPWEGYLCEQLVPAEGDIDWNAGERLVAVEDFRIETAEGLIRLTVTAASGMERALDLALR